MNDLAQAIPASEPLTETQRVLNVFVAPGKTFDDIRRKATFWGPLLILLVLSVAYSFTIQQKVGWEQVFQNSIRQLPLAAQNAAASQSETMKTAQVKIAEIATYASSLLGLLFTAIIALVLWVTVNFGFGGKAKYGQVFAVSFYSWMVADIKFLLAIIALLAGLAPESFLLNNPVGSNIGYYLSTDTPLWIRSLCMHIDVFEIWGLVLTTIGISIIAKVSRGKAAAVVFGWWIVWILVKTALTVLPALVAVKH
ncbi:MAG TPA: YIP1 family protein [Acidobacteriaceae bacterium]|nr:YIP1 family protein [Acidobacteriaceae bacterium]